MRSLSYLIAALLPRLGLYLGFKVLANPFSSRQYKFKAVTPLSEFEVTSPMGKIKLFFFTGGPKHLILTHGWADTSKSFQTIVKKLVDNGYSVWVFDHIGHGKSEGSLSHVKGFIDGFTCVYQFVEEHLKQSQSKVHGFISHSMGGVAVINQERSVLDGKKIIILAVPFHFFDTIFEIIDSIGISKKIFSNMIKKIEDDYSFVADEVNLKHHEDILNESLLFIHDVDDEHCPYEDVRDVVEKSNAELITTTGLKHRGLFKNSEVLEHIVSFLGK